MVRGIEDGLSYQLIADLHFISFETVRSHMHNVYCKLQMNPRTSDTGPRPAAPVSLAPPADPENAP